MWRLIWFFAGWHRIRVTGASPQWILGAMAKRRVAFRDFRKTDDFTAELVIPRRALPAAEKTRFPRHAGSDGAAGICLHALCLVL